MPSKINPTVALIDALIEQMGPNGEGWSADGWRTTCGERCILSRAIGLRHRFPNAQFGPVMRRAIYEATGSRMTIPAFNDSRREQPGFTASSKGRVYRSLILPVLVRARRLAVVASGDIAGHSALRVAA